MQGRRREG